MDEKSKKRCRKSKLVPRECLDSDDENIAVMQKEIEETLIQIKNKSILKKLNNPIPPLEFSVKVEVEEIDEEVEINKVEDKEQDLNIKIDSVKSLSEPSTQVPKSKAGPNVPHYIIANDVVRSEFDKLSLETKSEADKLIEIYVQNYLGRKRIPLELNPVDEKLQNIFRRKWKNFRISFPDIRDIPLMYKCYICNIAWWYLYDFREHVLQHQDALYIDLETNCHECNVIAYQGTLPAMKGIWIDSKCWRCSKTVVAHVFLGNVKTTGYKCSGCMEKFYTCRSLSEHESNCFAYRDLINFGEDRDMTFACKLCPIKVRSDDELLEHMVLCHSVRCDIPMDWHLKTCGKCEIPYQLQALHDCPYKPPATSCEFCLQKFKSQLLVLIHLNFTKHFYPCKICGKELRKQCMELEHLMEHTDNYVQLFSCIYCPDSILFPDLISVNDHKYICHKRQLENKNLGSCYEMVVVPKRLVAKHELKKNIESGIKQKSLLRVVEKKFDTACTGLLGFLDKSKDEETNTVIKETSNYDENTEKVINENSDHLDKNSVEIDNKDGESTENSHHLGRKSVENDENQKKDELNNTDAEEFIVACKIKKKPQKRGKNVCRILKPYSRPEKPKREKKVFCKPKCVMQNKVNIDLKTAHTTHENDKEVSTAKDSQLSDKVESIPQPEMVHCNTLDTSLVIKEEKLDDYEDADIIQEGLQIEEIKIESDVTIKEENDIDILEDNINTDQIANKERRHCNDLNNASQLDVIKEELVFDEYDPKHSGAPCCDVDASTADTSMVSDDVDIQALEPEVIIYHTYGKKLYKCKKCTFEGHHRAYKKHLKDDVHKWSKLKNRPKTQPRNTIEPQQDVQYTCTKCNYVYRTFYKYILHFKRVHECKPLKCPQCFRQSLNAQAFQSHVHAHIKDSFVTIYLITNKYEDDDCRHQCKICTAKVNTADFFEHWERHLEISKDGEPSKGYIPEMEHKHDLKKMLILLQGLDSVSGRGNPNKLRDCHKCKRRFERKNECKRHFIEHLLVDAYHGRQQNGCLRCQICRKGFYNSEKYKRHMRDHGSLPLYMCDMCDKAFSDSSNFTKHKKVHNLSVLICDICNKKFTGKTHIERHMVMHQKTKPMVCQGCNKMFYTESSFRKHMKRGQIRYKCPWCEVFFNCLREKWDHMWEVHKERKFKADCPLCEKSFRKHQDVKKHIRLDHANYMFKYVPNKTPLIEPRKEGVVLYVNDSRCSADTSK